MIRHYITKYKEDGILWAEAWIQVDLLGKSWCLSRRRISVGVEPPEGGPAS
ncbi:MAG: hypothetical protein HFJ74_01360 [Eggerthellaceae bacterium]|jgi:hypothetical protein|nr:hypothetical protein [Eggerthellaceae bacterium]